jgi:hypothetical protein
MKDKIKEGAELSRSRSRPPVAGLERSSSYGIDSVGDATKSLRSVSLHKPNKGLTVGM